MRESATIVVTLKPDMWSAGHSVALPIDVYEARKHFAPIDFPKGNDIGIAMLFCTPEAEKKLIERHAFIATVAKHVARALADIVGAKDT